jgi:hypothetical protein
VKSPVVQPPISLNLEVTIHATITHYFKGGNTMVQSSIFLNACIPTRTFPCSSSSVPNLSELPINAKDVLGRVRTFEIVGFHASRESSKDCFCPRFLVRIILLLCPWWRWDRNPITPQRQSWIAMDLRRRGRRWCRWIRWRYL